MDNPTEFIPKVDKDYPISWFREPFSLLAAMFCQLFGLPNYRDFKDEWTPIAHHLLLIGECFNLAQILSVSLKEAIEKYQKGSTSRKPTFYMSRYVMDIFYVTSSFPTVCYNWANTSLPVHIYFSYMWENNFVTWIYEICDQCIGSMY